MRGGCLRLARLWIDGWSWHPTKVLFLFHESESDVSLRHNIN